MFLFRCFHPKKQKTRNVKAPSKINNGSFSSPQSTDNEDDESTINYSIQDDPEYRDIYNHNMGCSLAAATSGEDSSVAAFSDNSSLTSATTNGNQMFLQINNLGHNLLGSNSNNSYREDDDDDSLFLHRLYADQQPQPSSFRYKNDTTFQVLLPAGKAGMVLNTPTEGWGPTVYYVKPDCAVANKVQVGDMLLSADGQDCTHMTALEASRLLSKKADNAKRLLVFARKR